MKTIEKIVRKIKNINKNRFSGYPLYPASEDIYSKFRKENDVDLEEISTKKILIDNQKININSIENLDVPGSELDDAQENIGSEDEENNYYSLSDNNQEDLRDEKPE